MVSAKQGIGSLRWIDYARRSMQRLGFLKVVLRLASTSRSQTLESLTRAFHATVTEKLAVRPQQRVAFADYVRDQQLHRRYQSDSETAQVQDIWLSDPILPSHSGAITGDLERAGYRHAVYVEMPTWATRLRLIREHNYTLTDRGRVLLMFGTDSPETLTTDGIANPLYLNESERYICLFALLDADGDLLASMFRNLLNEPGFTRATAGEAAVEALQEFRAHRLKNTSVGPLQQVRARVDRTIAAVKKQRAGGLGPKESLATPRTEPLVDCGVLTKTHAGSYEYAFTKWGKTFLQNLTAAPSVSDFLESGLSTAMALASARRVSAQPSLEAIQPPYTRLRSGLGYVSMRELAVAATAQALKSPSEPLFEILSVEEALKRSAHENSRYVRLAHGRTGGLAQVRIDQRAFPSR